MSSFSIEELFVLSSRWVCLHNPNGSWNNFKLGISYYECLSISHSISHVECKNFRYQLKDWGIYPEPLTPSATGDSQYSAYLLILSTTALVFGINFIGRSDSRHCSNFLWYSSCFVFCLSSQSIGIFLMS